MRSTSSPRAVSMMIGTCERLRSWRQSVSPSSPGSIRSSTSRSTCERSMTRRISFPSATAVVRKSCFSRYWARRLRISRSSSTMRRWGRSLISASRGGCARGYFRHEVPGSECGREFVSDCSLVLQQPSDLWRPLERARVKTQQPVGGCRELRLARGERLEAAPPLLRGGRAREVDVQLEVARLGGRELLVQPLERRRHVRGEERKALRRARLDQRRGEQQIELAAGLAAAQHRAQSMRVATGALPRERDPECAEGLLHLLEVPERLGVALLRAHVVRRAEDGAAVGEVERERQVLGEA